MNKNNKVHKLTAANGRPIADNQTVKRQVRVVPWYYRILGFWKNWPILIVK